MTTISTEKGEVVLREPSVGLLRSMRQMMPLGAIRLPQRMHNADFGLVFQCGQREVFGVKRQPVDCDAKDGQVRFLINAALVARSLPIYQQRGYSGLLMPCPYLREKPGDRAEVGVVCFGAPAPQGREYDEASERFGLDAAFGRGFAAMVTAFLEALQRGAEESGLPLARPIGLDVRARSQLGTLGLGLMAVGPELVCLKTALVPEDPFWAELCSAGVTAVVHVPSVPVTIGEEQFAIAKGLAS